MRNILKKAFSIFFLLLLLFIPVVDVSANEQTRFATYFSGIGCPHCAKVSPELHKRIDDGKLIVIEYEIYKNLGNSQALNKYAETYNMDLGIPQLLFNSNLKESGDTPILDKLDEMILNSEANTIYLSDGNSVSFPDFNLNDLERYPTIYSKDRVAIKKSLKTLTDTQNQQIKDFIYLDNIEDAIKDLDGKKVKASKVEYPGGSLNFENAVEINGWLLQWNGAQINSTTENTDTQNKDEETSSISFGRILSLGLADSVNPCALSILALVLISIVTYNPGKRKQILLAGFAFISAVMIMYLIYGFLIIKAFEVVQSITSIREFLYGDLGINLILGIGAIVLGLLGLKDYFAYKPGGIATETPLFLRPKMAALIAKVTSPLAAFVVGLLVTLFLLPCTIGPYIILGGLLAGEGFVNAIPSLLLYNFIFVLPMITVTVLVYIGSKKAEDVKDWKDKNVRYMHLIAGILMLIIGILMVSGKF
ncbi:MAG: hypothetical protein UR32_C0009G0003 [candidate division WS6 bacterium GW2011_GWE2_33_157]|nr:MAG: hypothetical protein UR32_C0009G0003 [candidate division WS6 bacterium GW2011_GWE2_33_157]KKP56690.1 MAG: Cytochrome c biogenesis protein [candidate division WS6 bacterium GW2011_GWF2_33_92]OGC37719.1 MAG: hypothetical protein A2436_02025 [candidate division WS6 bacterium RIFOXYC1_FULL_33_9]